MTLSGNGRKSFSLFSSSSLSLFWLAIGLPFDERGKCVKDKVVHTASTALSLGVGAHEMRPEGMGGFRLPPIT